MIEFQKGYCIEQRFIISTLVKNGRHAQYFRVKDSQTEKLCFLKLIDLSQVRKYQFSSDGSSLLEAEILSKIDDLGFPKYVAGNPLKINDTNYVYFVQELVIGETVFDHIQRKGPIGQESSLNIMSNLLQALETLHGQEYPVMHNDIRPQNVMLDMLERENLKPKLLGFGAARYLTQLEVAFSADDQDVNYTATEAIQGKYSFSSDIFSVGALYFYLLCGHAPWDLRINAYQQYSHDISNLVTQLRMRKLSFSASPYRIADSTKAVIEKALAFNPADRFKSSTEFRKALHQEFEASLVRNDNSNHSPKFKIAINKPKPDSPTGFDAIAGMQNLKEILQRDVIDALQNREKYQNYKLDIPNGMMLYGPPGCGKTYFVERLAEELGHTYVTVKPSELKSKWVGEGVRNIAKMFDKARENAPCTLFIDELDALVAERSSSRMTESESNMVNEFLLQMNECAKAGVFVIGATNLPEKIDLAVTRRGRIDKQFYLPPPDFNAREAMFELHLRGRPLVSSIDYHSLALNSDNYVASDLKYAVDEAARIALQLDKPISQTHLEEVLNSMDPSVTKEQLKRYEGYKSNHDDLDKNLRRMGF